MRTLAWGRADLLPPGSVGLLGGSFDPVHRAHVALARVALAQLSLRELRWVVAGDPWQKRERIVTASGHRLAMVRQAVADAAEPRFAVETCELHRTGPSFTIDTVMALRAQHPCVPCWVLVLGQDQYARLHTWHRWQELLPLVVLAVAARGGQEVRASAEVEGMAHRRIRLDLPAMEISSTLVRACVARGEDITPMVGGGVAGYIAQHRLYSE